MRIVIDMQGAQTESRFRGIGRYTLSLVKAIIRNRGNHKVILALNGLFPETIEPIRAAFDDLLPQENIRTWYSLGQTQEYRPDSEWRCEVAKLMREAFLAELKPDVVLLSSLFEGFFDHAVTGIDDFTPPQIPTVVILYDIIPLLNSKQYLEPYSPFARFYKKKIEHLKRASRLLAISESTAAETCDALGISNDKVMNISAACDDIFRPVEITKIKKQQLLERFVITQPFILYSGRADARKNLHRLVKAYARLPKALHDSYQLVIVGKARDAEMFDLLISAKSFGMSKSKLIFTGYISDEALVHLYNLCTVFVFPSWHEGFGLPALEAMSCGAPVIGANASSVPEVIGYKDALFDPFDELAICKKLTHALEDVTFRRKLAAHGLEQAKKFSWDESARRAISVLEGLYSTKAWDTRLEEPENKITRLVDAIVAATPSGISDKKVIKIAHILSRNHHVTNQKQLLVDISELVQRDARSGIQRVTRSILKELLKNPPEGYAVEPVYATKSGSGYCYARRFTSSFCGVMNELADEPIDYRSGDIFLGLDLQHHLVIAQKDYLALMRRDGVKIYFFVYDMLPIRFPHYFFPRIHVIHKEWLLTIADFDGAICISRTVSGELKEWLAKNGPKRLREFKNTWIHLGADIENSVPFLGLPDDAADAVKEMTLRTTFLTVGTVEPRKCHAQILDAFELLWKQGTDANFVIVGKQGWLTDTLTKRLRRHCELNKRLFWLESISDEYLENIYAVSTCLIAASEGEGFGLPLIEAARYKLPIIARDIPVFREVAGEHAFYFDGLDPRMLKDAILQWLGLYKQGNFPRSDNMPKLTWKQSAERLKQIIIDDDWRKTIRYYGAEC